MINIFVNHIPVECDLLFDVEFHTGCKSGLYFLLFFRSKSLHIMLHLCLDKISFMPSNPISVLSKLLLLLFIAGSVRMYFPSL